MDECENNAEVRMRRQIAWFLFLMDCECEVKQYGRQYWIEDRLRYLKPEIKSKVNESMKTVLDREIPNPEWNHRLNKQVLEYQRLKDELDIIFELRETLLDAHRVKVSAINQTFLVYLFTNYSCLFTDHTSRSAYWTRQNRLLAAIYGSIL